MAISFQCPSCQKPYKVKDELAGKKAACTQCKTVMTVPRPTMSAEDSHAVEALATAALVEEARQHEAAAAATEAAIKLECEYCFETVEFPFEKAGKKAPCPSCRRIIQVPVPATGGPKKDWRTVENTLTMARKDTESAPVGAWGNAQLQQQVVSREALLEAKVVVDRKTLMAPDRTKLYIALAVTALIVGVGGFYFYRGKVADDRRIGLVTDAIKAAPSLPAGWPAAVLTAAGEFYLHEEVPDLSSAKKQLQDARAAIRLAETPSDKAGLLAALVLIQAEFVGDDDKINAKKALEWDETQRQLRQTLQICKELPVEDGWLVIEELTRKLRSVGPKRPMIVALAPEALTSEADRPDALACVALVLHAVHDPAAEKITEDLMQLATSGAGSSTSTRLVALLVARKQLAKAQQILAEPTGDDPPLAARLAYAEGYARAGDLEKARKIAMLNGPVEHKACALAMLADAALDTGSAGELEPAIAFVAEQGKKFTLPAWAVMRLGRACGRAGRDDLAKKLADNVKLPAVIPWLELAALQTELDKTSSALDAANVKSGDKSAAAALAWIALARHNAKVSRTDPHHMLSVWPNEHAKAAGSAGAALGIQDRQR